MTEIEWLESFRFNLSSLLHEANMTQRELADVTGINESTISRYLSSDPYRWLMPSAKTVLNMAYALDCEVSDLIDFGERVI